MERSYPVLVPRLETERLVLREYRVDDFDAFAAHLADPESTAFIDVADRQLAWRIFACHSGLWVLFGAGWWAMELRETGAPVGVVGAFYRLGMPGIELGWNTYREYWGRGFASEAAAAAMRYAFEVKGESRAKALITAGNVPSIRVAQRLGMAWESETELYGAKVSCYTREREA